MTRLLKSTPKDDGFRMPGEFEPHAGTWMLWPERPDNWRLGAKPAQNCFVSVASAIARSEPVTVGVSPRQFANARAMLPSQVRVVEITSDDSWMRDCGPTFVVDGAGAVRAIDWVFNAWGGLEGGLYFPWDQDDLVASKVAEIERVDRYRAPIVLEGGSIHVDGEGTLIATEECLLNPNRNPGLSREEIERILADYLGIGKTVWLGRGVFNDETDGHVDNLCCFVRPGVVALTWTDDTSDPQYEISKDAYERLSRSTDACGRKFEIHKLHQPGPLFMSEEESRGVDVVEGTEPRLPGARLAGSYVNFYIANGVIALPVFDDSHDENAIAQLSALFPERTVVPVPAREILLGGGNIHCITQQQPAPRKRAG
ncbi:MAG: agmatine deiminase [Parvibaculaceae bacterium]|nr:agmatine deiminase [Parvibaculaceae bacterium]